MSSTDDLGELLDQYLLWVQRVLDTRDAVRAAYGHGEYGSQFIDQVCSELIVCMLKQPSTLPSDGLSYSTRIVNAARPFLTGRSRHPGVMPAMPWQHIEGYLKRCPEDVRAAIVCGFVRGYTIEGVAKRTGWSRDQARRLCAKAVEYLHDVDDATCVRVMGTVEPNHAAYPPSALLALQANASRELRERAETNRLKFWAEQARELSWDHDFSEVLDWSNAPFARWFVGGTINVAVNCVDRHVDAGNGGRIAIHWVGEPGDFRDISYRQLQLDVCKAANYFTSIGLQTGDRVAIYMPVLPEAIVAMLACARLGLVHLVVPAGSPAAVVRSQVIDSQAKVVITSDGEYRRGGPAPVKQIVDEALTARHAPCRSVEAVIVVRRTGHDPDLNWAAGRDVWWRDTVEAADEHHSARPFDAEQPLFLLYTSGTDGKPHGIVHSSGGYLTQVHYVFHSVFDHKEGRDVFWCDSQLGCAAGHYLVFGPLSHGATSVMYEGSANIPDPHRHLQIIETYCVTVYYAGMTLIETFMKWSRELTESHDLSSLRLVAGMGEPDNPDAWQWFREVLGGNHCPIVNTWWQPETGTVMIAPLPGLMAAEPGSAASPVPGISAHIVDDEGDLVALGESGRLVVDRPWPSMLRGVWRDDERFVKTYWSQFAGRGWYFTGVNARYDQEDAIRVIGRGGDVITESDDCVSISEGESALTGTPA